MKIKSRKLSRMSFRENFTPRNFLAIRYCLRNTSEHDQEKQRCSPWLDQWRRAGEAWLCAQTLRGSSWDSVPQRLSDGDCLRFPAGPPDGPPWSPHMWYGLPAPGIHWRRPAVEKVVQLLWKLWSLKKKQKNMHSCFNKHITQLFPPPPQIVWQFFFIS